MKFFLSILLLEFVLNYKSRNFRDFELRQAYYEGSELAIACIFEQHFYGKKVNIHRKVLQMIDGDTRGTLNTIRNI